MTPKEKAEELFNKFHIEVLDREGTSAMNGFEAKQCALIAVDEIIRTLNDDIRDINVVGNILLDLLEWWREVEQEIEKL